MKRILATLVIAFLSLQSIAQTPKSYCDLNLTPSGIKSIAYKDHGDRCEGFYISRNKDTTLDLVSFTAGPFEYDLTRSGALVLSKARNIVTDINVRSLAIPLRTYYRMDTYLTSDKSITWPMAYCLYPKRLEPTTIGVFGYKGDRYYPVSIDGHSTGDYFIKLRSFKDIDELQISFIADNNSNQTYEGQTVKLPRFPTLIGKPIELNLNEYYPDLEEVSELQIILRPRTKSVWNKPVIYNLVLNEKDKGQ